MVPTTPDVFAYSDFRLFLRDMYQDMKSQDAKFSQRMIAQKVGASSSGWFADVTSGRIALTGTYLVRLARFCRLNTAETEYFQTLVGYEQAGSLEERNVLMTKLLSFKRTRAAVVSKEQFEFYSRWYIPAIRELLFVFDFKDDVRSLAKKLTPAVTPRQAASAIATLKSLGFVKANARGFLKPCDPVLTKEAGFKSLHWANYQKANLELAIGALDTYDKTQRDMSAVTICLSTEAMESARQEIEQLRRKLLSLSERDTARDRVFQCNIQLFPLTM